MGINPAANLEAAIITSDEAAANGEKFSPKTSKNSPKSCIWMKSCKIYGNNSPTAKNSSSSLTATCTCSPSMPYIMS
ncbi:hypothetical protein [Coleofasciculus sp. E1-EBD-02]|uniref:hypothetical protein n=1 Tax=Coleofasciculus sp. E1-EBD-02 TaxID=3068481 RepID=UPI0032FE2C44